MGQPHKHAELIKLWAEGAEIEVRYCDGSWQKAHDPIPWKEVYEYRIKPEPPKYPQTKLTDDELLNAFEQCGAANIDRARFIANAAISRAIEDGDVVPEAMLEKVGQAVADLCRWNVPDKHMADIIAKVKEGK